MKSNSDKKSNGSLKTTFFNFLVHFAVLNEDLWTVISTYWVDTLVRSNKLQTFSFEKY